MPAPRTRVQVGIDAAITANHSVAVRRPGAGSAATRFSVPPTLAGLQTLTRRLAEVPNVMAVAEPTSMTRLQLAALYQRLMVERGHCHTSATVAVARKLAERTWTVLSRGKPYQLCDLDGQPITERAPGGSSPTSSLSATRSARGPGRTAPPPIGAS